MFKILELKYVDEIFSTIWWTLIYIEHSVARTNMNQSKLFLTSTTVYHSIEVSTQEAQNLHQLKSPLSDLTS